MPRVEGTPHPVDVHVGAFLRARRNQQGLSQQSVAKALNLSLQQIQKYETGDNRISASRLWAFCGLLHCPVADVFAGLDGDFLHVQPAEPDPILIFAGLPGALEVARAWPRLPVTMRTAVLNVMRAAIVDEAAG